MRACGRWLGIRFRFHGAVQGRNPAEVGGVVLDFRKVFVAL
jgi:hypothetical protein